MQKHNSPSSSLGQDQERRGCPECDWKEFRVTDGRIVPCECWRKRERETRIRRLKADNVGKRFVWATFHNYQPRNKSQRIAKATMLKNPRANYFIWGDYSAGKTHLLAAQYDHVLNEDYLLGNPGVAWASELELAKDLRTQFSGDEDYIPRIDLLELAGRPKLHFFLDDLGKAKATEFLRQELLFLVDMLFRNGFGLSVTANEPLEALADDDRIGGAVVRRIDDMCELLHIKY